MLKIGEDVLRNIAVFHSYIHKTNNIDDCWLWLGATSEKGYGLFMRMRAHRIAYKLHYGIESAVLICHTCDNPPCVNPHHLFEGSAQDNTDDMMRKDRNHFFKGGFDSARTVMTEEKLDLAIRLYSNGELSVRQVAKSIGLDHKGLLYWFKKTGIKVFPNKGGRRQVL